MSAYRTGNRSAGVSLYHAVQIVRSLVNGHVSPALWSDVLGWRWRLWYWFRWRCA